MQALRVFDQIFLAESTDVVAVLVSSKLTVEVIPLTADLQNAPLILIDNNQITVKG